MKTDRSHIPEAKRQELDKIVELVGNHFEPNMIVLYGSYARGDYVDIEREYQSDFDILVVCGQKQKKNVNRINALEQEIRLDDDIKTKVHIQYESIGTINAEIRNFNYLFVDIAREGVILFDNKDVTFEPVKELQPKERYEKAIKDNEYWLESSRDFTKGYQFFLAETIYNKAAFNLHQRVEHLFMALLLVFTGYKPKTHDLDDLIALGDGINKDLRSCFPKDNEENKHLYHLLQKAYVDARYDMNYSISEKELHILESWAVNFESRVKQLCADKLEELRKDADEEGEAN